MKLDHLTPNELEAYNHWNTADEQGGDCDGIGYAWAAFDEHGIILTEDSDGFVGASTFGADNLGFRTTLRNLRDADDEYYTEHSAEADEEDTDEEDYDELVGDNLSEG